MPLGNLFRMPEEMLLTRDPEVHILRQIVIESGNETQDFFEDLEISPASFTKHVEDTGTDFI